MKLDPRIPTTTEKWIELDEALSSAAFFGPGMLSPFRSICSLVLFYESTNSKYFKNRSLCT